eukprot:TRINITY_DN332_c0_g1_i6.p1 TRINITY_DN332_c0_g1~~TRINITY_DN332_c0_g1_i6.p1  ORF type:complete len:365 (-),score=59.42 TRINITY_DN332_c0_g1_i6:45-1139(-)
MALSLASRISTSTDVAKGYLLSICYSASIGGLATPVGTAANLIMVDFMKSRYPLAPEITFPVWMGYGVPLAVLFLIVLFLYISSAYLKDSPADALIDEVKSKEFLQQELKKLGNLTWPEKVITADFLITVILWIFRADLIFSGTTCVSWKGCFPGWANIFPNANYIRDGSVATAAAMVLFFIPARDGKGSKILDWNTAKLLNWDVLWLLGGGFALAKGIEDTGLAQFIGLQIHKLPVLPIEILLLMVITLCVFLTEIINNTPVAQVAIPILCGVSEGLRVNPFYLAVPATISASCAFMLPTATGANSIAYSLGYLSVWDMAKAGLFLNLASILIVSLAWFGAGQWAYGTSKPSDFPFWANITSS